MARHQDQLPATPAERGEKIVYHDPCYLGRYRGVYDEPREVLARSGDVGGSAALARTLVSAAAQAAGWRFWARKKASASAWSGPKNWRPPGADIVGAACPFCNTMFRDALAATSDSAQVAGYCADRGDVAALCCDER